MAKRRKATFRPRTCEICREVYTPASNVQKYCKACRKQHEKEYHKRYCREHAEWIKERSKAYCREHAEEISQYQKHQRREYPKEIRERDKRYYNQHARENRERAKRYYHDHAEEMKKRHRRWHEENKRAEDLFVFGIGLNTLLLGLDEGAGHGPQKTSEG